MMFCAGWGRPLGLKPSPLDISLSCGASSSCARSSLASAITSGSVKRFRATRGEDWGDRRGGR